MYVLFIYIYIYIYTHIPCMSLFELAAKLVGMAKGHQRWVFLQARRGVERPKVEEIQNEFLQVV